MSGGERPIGAARGKQSDTEALCHPPPPPAVVDGHQPDRLALRSPTAAWRFLPSGLEHVSPLQAVTRQLPLTDRQPPSIGSGSQ